MIKALTLSVGWLTLYVMGTDLFVATAWATGFPSFLVARFVAGGAAAAITPTVYAFISDVAPLPRRGAWLSFVGSGIFTALWSSAPLGSLLGYRWGWHWVFIILAIIPLPLAGINGWLLKRIAGVVRAKTQASRYGRLIVHVSATTLWAIALYATYIYMGAGLQDAAHYSPNQIAEAIAAFGVGMVSGVLSGGHLADRFGPRGVSTIGCFGSGLGALALHQTLGSFSLSFLMLLLFSFGAALYFSSFQVFLAHHHNQQRGAALAWNNSALYLGITLGSFFGGLLLAHGGFKANLLFTTGVAFMASAWAFFVERPTVSSPTASN